jgi:hypothetical protein
MTRQKKGACVRKLVFALVLGFSSLGFAGQQVADDMVTALTNPKVLHVVTQRNMGTFHAIRYTGTSRCPGEPSNFALEFTAYSRANVKSCTVYVSVGSCERQQERTRVSITPSFACT